MVNNKSSVYTVKDTQNILGISRNSAYTLVNSKAFPIVHIGTAIRIPQAKFDEWLNSERPSA